MSTWSRWRLFLIAGAVIGGIYLGVASQDTTENPPESVKPTAQEKYFANGPIRLWYSKIPKRIRESQASGGQYSNIMKADYAGPESCEECHEENYGLWRKHSHRSMNLLATQENVLGDFESGKSIKIQNGVGRFFTQDGRYFMELHRDDVQRLFEATRTLGSRFFQYYVGRQVGGPAHNPQAYRRDHLLPFGYWLSEKMWVPTVHVSGSDSDVRPYDPFAAPMVVDYAVECSSCHTTRPLGDSMVTRIWDDADHVFVRRIDFQLGAFLEEAHPQMWAEAAPLARNINEQIDQVAQKLMLSSAVEKAATLGISCEACHLGLKKHVNDHENFDPLFYASSPHAVVTARSPSDPVYERSDSNSKHICGRCHAGERPRYANGIGTWNSTEFSDAMRGSCYSEMTCLNCHNPHEGIGKRWKKTPEEDDESCLGCHESLTSESAREKHTHHKSGSPGSRCMNCHMPRINEGLEDMVRTHSIFKPTNTKMIESGQANACNLCHLDKSINWTLRHLKDRYGQRYNEDNVTANYIDRDKPAVLTWLNYSMLPTPESGRPDEASNAAATTRLSAVYALIKSKQRWALPFLIEALNDESLVNRQLTQKHLEEWLKIKFSKWGYVFYQTEKERAIPLADIKKKLLREAAP